MNSLCSTNSPVHIYQPLHVLVPNYQSMSVLLFLLLNLLMEKCLSRYSWLVITESPQFHKMLPSVSSILLHNPKKKSFSQGNQSILDLFNNTKQLWYPLQNPAHQMQVLALRKKFSIQNMLLHCLKRCCVNTLVVCSYKYLNLTLLCVNEHTFSVSKHWNVLPSTWKVLKNHYMCHSTHSRCVIIAQNAATCDTTVSSIIIIQHDTIAVI